MREIFKQEKTVIGMVHVQALPGTPANKYSMTQIIAEAVQEAKIYEESGMHSIMLENMHDVPYLKEQVGPEIIAAMTAVAGEVRKAVKVPLGIQILAGANKEALAVAHVSDFDYIRAEGFVFGHVADEGYIQSCAAELLRYRKQIGAERIAVFTDIKKKHSAHSITEDVGIGETASAAEFFLSDGVIITGSSTGKSAKIEDLQEVRQHTSLPIFIGSGITLDNISEYISYADVFIVGSYFKEGGKWSNPLSAMKCKHFMDKFYLLTGEKEIK